jgi:hypothetical protein
MIIPSTLRIGNCVEWNQLTTEKKGVQITSISETSDLVGVKYLGTNGIWHNDMAKLKYLEPILITPKLLERYNFKDGT